MNEWFTRHVEGQNIFLHLNELKHRTSANSLFMGERHLSVTGSGSSEMDGIRRMLIATANDLQVVIDFMQADMIEKKEHKPGTQEL